MRVPAKVELPDGLACAGVAEPLEDLWLELRAAMRGVLEDTSLAHLVARSGSPSPTA